MRLAKEQRRSLIISSGVELANSHGKITCATIEAVAHDLRMSRSGVIYHFPNHTDLWTAIIGSGHHLRPGVIDEARRLGLAS